jgi:hypothetical protein
MNSAGSATHTIASIENLTTVAHEALRIARIGCAGA